MGGMGM